jgi:molecular chaperone GrpE (heat shock protein)
MISLSLLDLLNDHGLVPFTVQAGSDYSPSEHKISKVIETDNPALDRKVAEFLLCGFTDSETGRLMRQAEINIYKCSNS